MRTKMTITFMFTLMMALPPLAAADTSAVQAGDLDAALAVSAVQENVAREQVKALLARDDVRAMAAAAGLDLRRADAAVATLDGEELQRVAQNAAAANEALAGGSAITISLAAAILIVILVVLLVD
jgi:hypothetical protein